MRPAIYLSEKDTSSLYRVKKQSDGFFKAKAYSQDANTVFHAFVEIPQVFPSGTPANCLLKFWDKGILGNDIKSYLEKFIDANNKKKKIKPTVFVFIISDINASKNVGFFYDSKNLIECDVKHIPIQRELQSRNQGLIETDVLKDKKVAIIGLGSGGSLIALELAKAGVGKFILFDFDRIELSNIARHVCGINDLGRYKTLAVRDCIWQKNPLAEIITHEININESFETFEASIKDCDLLICASDTNTSRFNINQVSLNNKITALYGRAITRAAGGDVLRVRPYEGPCLNCLFSAGLISKEEEISQIRQVRSEMPAYVTELEANQMVQVGLSSDIAPIANMITKLALVELSKGRECGISSLEQDLVADFYLWANRRERIYANWPKMEYGFNKQSILRWYGARVNRNENCLVCGEKHLEEGDNIFS